MNKNIVKGKKSTSEMIRIINEILKENKENKENKERKIVFARGTYNFLPKKAKEIMEKAGIKAEVVLLKRGKKAKVNIELIKSLSHLSAKEISKKLNIPLRTVYYHLRKIKEKKE